jgi:hypothetical protein
MATPNFSSETEQVMGPVIAVMPQRAEQRSAQGIALGSLPTRDDVKRTTWFIFVLLILLLLAIFVVAIPGERLLQDPDLYWHTATGRLIWTTGSLPRVDEFSHTFRGHPWIARDWLSDLAFYGSYSLDGWRGVSILAAVSIALAYGLLFLMLARTMRLTVAIGVAVVMVFLSMPHLHARTQLLADGLIVVWIAGLVRAVDTKTPPNWCLLPVMTLWANVHGGFIVGLALAAGLAAEAIVEGPSGERRFLARRWTAFLLAAVAASCLTPYGWEPLLLTFKGFISGNEAKEYIQEWQPVSMASAPINLIFVLLMMFGAILTGVKIRLGRLVLLVAITGIMLSAVRYAGPYNLVIPLLLATPLCAQFPFLRLSQQIDSQPLFFIPLARAARRALYPLYATIALMLFGVGAFGRPVAPDPKITPAAAVDYIVSHNDGGNVYNTYSFGGYLIFRKVPTFIDGRTDQLFLNGFFSQRTNTTTKHPRKIIQYLEEYNIKFVLVEPDSFESQELQATAGWRKVYSDEISALFEKEP